VENSFFTKTEENLRAKYLEAGRGKCFARLQGRQAGKRRGSSSPAKSKGGQRYLFHSSIIGNFKGYQDLFETNLLQLFAQQDNSQCFFL